MSRWSRREILDRSMWATAAALAGPSARSGALFAADAGQAPGPNEILNVAVVGVKGRGGNHLGAFLGMKDVRVTGIVDVDARQAIVGNALKLVEKKNGKPPRFEQDIRKMLEDKDLDAVSIATTDHTHVLLAIWAIQAGKHVYVEKPVSHSIFEGRQLVKAARKYKRICQVGHQCRSSKGIQDLMAFLHGGKLGKVKLARGLCYKRRGSIGKKADEAPPEGVNYDLWLGPAPYRPYNPNRFHYNWHWFWDYGNSDMTAQGVHQMDIARWGLDKRELARRVMCLGGRLGYEDDGEVPNTEIAWYDYGDCELIFETRGLDTDAYSIDPAGKDKQKEARIGVVFHCEGGTVVNPSYTGAVAFDPDGKVIQSFGGRAEDHFGNFLGAIRSGRHEDLACDIEEGHLSASLCHMGQISWRLGQKQPLAQDKPFGDIAAANEAFDRMRAHLKEQKVLPDATQIQVGPLLTMDPKSERFTGNDKANGDLLMKREYRKPFVVPDEV